MNGTSVLLVEDDPHLGRGIRDFLSAKGYEVNWVRDGLAAIREVRNSSFDLALVDIYLPKRDGLSVCSVIKERNEETPVIAMSAANVQQEMRSRLDLEQRPDLFLVKPIPLRQLTREIELLLSARQVPAGSSITAHPHAVSGISFAFVETLMRAAVSQRSGVVEVDALGVSTRLYVRSGAIVQASGGPFSNSLWRRIQREERVSRQQLVELLQAAQAIFESGRRARTAEVLLDSGLITTSVVEGLMAEQVRECALLCFQWENATAHFRAGLAHLDPLPLLQPTPIAPLLREGIERFWSVERVETALAGILPGFVRLGAHPDSLSRTFRLTPEERDYLGRVRGTESVGTHLSADDPLPRSRRARLLATLYLGNAVEVLSTPSEGAPPSDPGPTTLEPPSAKHSPFRELVFREYLRVKGQPDHAALRLPPNPQADAVLTHFESLATPFRPEMIPAVLPPRVRDWATEVYSILCRARDRLLAGGPTFTSDTERLQRLARVRAEIAYQRGRDFLDRNDPAHALRHFERAARLYPSGLEYGLFEAWVRYRWSGPPTNAGPQSRAELVTLAESLLAQDHRAVDARVVLAHLLLERREFDKASAHLQEARQIAPSDDRVIELLETLRKADS